MNEKNDLEKDISYCTLFRFLFLTKFMLVFWSKMFSSFSLKNIFAKKAFILSTLLTLMKQYQALPNKRSS